MHKYLTIFNIYREKFKKGCLGISNQKQEMKIDKYFEIPNDMSFDNYIKTDGCHRHKCVMLNRKELKTIIFV